MKKSINADDASNKIDIKREILEWVGVILISLIISICLNKFIIVNAVIPTASMETTIMTGDRIFGNRLAYKNDDPKRGDIVIFKYPDNESELFIKRTIGLPGETVNIIDGKVYINDSDTPLDEPYINGIPMGSYGPYVVPQDAYFVMGDNRNNSLDARFWNHTYVYKDKILGKAMFRYWPGIKKIQ